MARPARKTPRKSKTKSLEARFGLSPAHAAIARIVEATERGQREVASTAAGYEAGRSRLLKEGKLTGPRTFT